MRSKYLYNLRPEYFLSSGTSFLEDKYLNLNNVFYNICLGDSYLSKLDILRKERFESKIKNLRSGKSSDELPLITIDRNNLTIIPTQELVSSNKVKSISIEDTFMDAVVVSFDNKLYLIDGHHRFMNWLLISDLERIDLRLFDLDGEL